MSPAPDVERFIARWQAAGGSERANYQLFVGELCALLGLPSPEPASEDTRENAYVYERRVSFRHGDGGSSAGFMDCYRRGAFVLEAKKLRQTTDKGFDDAMQRARGQAEQYARALPAEEGRPPFLVVVDVGRAIELYAEFSRSGATYTPFPDPRGHRILLADLRREDIRERLSLLWHDPLGLDPSRRHARVTREVAAHLAAVARGLEQSGQPAEEVAGFLTRCLFSMFAEDVGLLPGRSFTVLLESLVDKPAQFVPLIGELWRAMDKGGFSYAIREEIPRFNGKLYKTPTVLPLAREHIEGLLEAARADWTQVEPAIFGTLLERALDPLERHALGAHYTPRAYVERLVLPTVIEPLRRQWVDAQAGALVLAGEGKLAEARREVAAFHHRLCQVRVLDPACGSGNFLYVTLEHMKRLEGEVMNQLSALAQGQALLETEGLTVDPHQFLGLEVNPRAAAIAELVLWIGYLQWHFRTRGGGRPPEPVLKDFRNIECRDAVLAWDAVDIATDAAGRVLSRWDGRSLKPHAVTGEPVPDESARLPLEIYRNPRRADWPEADYVVGNPPFIGNKRMRDALGDGYVEALRAAWTAVPDSADFVMFWWHHAAEQVRAGRLSRFGFITTNSLTQTFNRRVVQAALDQGVKLAFAIPDHPWVDSADGAAVRIAMTVADTGTGEGRLQTVTAEQDSGGEGLEVSLGERTGLIHADLTIGADVSAAVALKANEGLSNRGMIPHGEGFLVSPEEAQALDGGALARPYRNGKDLTDRPRGVLVIDPFGLTEPELRARYPATWQRLHDRVKPERDQNPRKARRERWWLFAESQPRLRSGLTGLTRYIATVYTAKHRVFQFLDGGIVPDDMVVAIASDDAFHLGVLSSRVHVCWALAAGGTLEDRPRYNKSLCFDPFPFPDATPEQRQGIRELAEQLDAHRKGRQAAHPELTLTGLYNVLEKLRSGAELTAKDKAVHEAGLVSVLLALHDDLDRAVLAAYGWPDLASAQDDEILLERLAALNAERVAGEAAGQVRWLRPDFQAPEAGPRPHPCPSPPLEGEGESRLAGHGEGKAPLPLEGGGREWKAPLPLQGGGGEGDGVRPPASRPGKLPWPSALPEQVALVARLLAESAAPVTEDALAARFAGRGAWRKRLSQLLETLVALGRARRAGTGYVGA